MRDAAEPRGRWRDVDGSEMRVRVSPRRRVEDVVVECSHEPVVVVSIFLGVILPLVARTWEREEVLLVRLREHLVVVLAVVLVVRGHAVLTSGGSILLLDECERVRVIGRRQTTRSH